MDVEKKKNRIRRFTLVHYFIDSLRDNHKTAIENTRSVLSE